MSTIASLRRERRLRAIARQIIRHGFTAREVAQSLARSALEYAETNIGEAARSLGLAENDITDLTHQAMRSILHEPSRDWQSDHGALPAWPSKE